MDEDRSRLEPLLVGHDARWFASWLRVGLLAYEFGENVPGRDPFPGAQHLIDPRQQLEESLTDIYSHLQDTEKEEFAFGLEQAMRRLDLSDEKDFILAQRLLSLAAVLGIRRAILVLAHLIDPAMDDEKNSDLILSLVEAVAAWPMVLHQETRQVLMRLAHANGFGELHARRALPALCKADPAGLSEYLRVLARPLHGRYASHLCRPINGQRWNERRRRVLEVITIVQDPTRLIASFEDWERRIPRGEVPSSRALQYDWWASAIEDEVIMECLEKFGVFSQQPAAPRARPVREPVPRPTAPPKTTHELRDEGLVDAEDEADANELFAERELEEA